MLAAMLFHMVQPPGDVDFPADFRTGGDFPIHKVPYLAGWIRFHIQNPGFPAGEEDPARIKGLAAGSGIEGAAVQGNQPPAGRLRGKYGGDFCSKGPQVRVVIIQAFGHAISSG